MDIFAIILMSIMVMAADSFLKRAGYEKSFNNPYFYMGMLVYMLTSFVWFFVLKNLKFSIANLMYGLFTMILSVMVGIIFFKEKLGAIEFLGVLMAVASVFILRRFS